METDDLLPLLSASRSRLVMLLTRRGTITVRDAAEALELAETTIRQHLGRLVDEGLIASTSQPAGRGRPTVHYHLTQRGLQLLPNQSAMMFRELLQHLVREGHLTLIEQFFREQWQQRHSELEARIRDRNATSLADRLDVLRAFLEDEGFVPEIEYDGDTLVLRQCNCPLAEGVAATRLPCRLEAALLENLLGRPLRRVSYIPDGNPVCSYTFRVPQAPVDDAKHAD